MAARPLPALGDARRGGRLPVGLCRLGRAGARRLHDDDRPPLCPSRGRQATCSAARSRRHVRSGYASTPPRVDERVGKRRWPAARHRCARTRTRFSPRARPRWTRTTTARPGRWCASPSRPCSPFSVSRRLMSETAELAGRLDVRLHTHLAEDPDEDSYCLENYGCRPVELFEEVGWLPTAPGWPTASTPTRPRSGASGEPGWASLIARAPTCCSRRLAPVAELLRRLARRPRLRRLVFGRLGLAVARSPDGAAPGPLPLRGGRRPGPARRSSSATLGGAACLGRQGEIGVLARVRWGPRVLAARRAQVRRGLERPGRGAAAMWPGAAYHTVVAGEPVVAEGRIVNDAIEDRLRRHRAASARIQGITGLVGPASGLPAAAPEGSRAASGCPSWRRGTAV